ncbi:hypothetical protein JD78_04091 [Modestobacter roseus]|uniref:Uncharacterized protein n=1 Tax=Modestobacter roseus TaxID=1181884 RepID=A0A562IWY7_9ACTN|nr:hypothetical protein JD78_04091 [Modestobacter roseus]
MSPSGGLIVLVVLFLALGVLAGHTLRVTLRGGLGPADPPASHPRVDPAGFPVLPEPRGALPRHPAQPRQPRGPRRTRPGRARLAAARIAAVVHTARESRAARRMSARVGG